MKQLRSPRQLIKAWHRREKATIDRVADAVGEPKNATATVHSPYTASGLPVEDQLRKAWRPWTVGLATF